MYPSSSEEAMAMCDASLRSREGRTPYTEAIHIVTVVLPKALCRPGGDLDATRNALLDNLYIPMLEDVELCEADIDEMASGLGTFRLEAKVVAYCVLALRALERGEKDLAWSFISDAQYWAGITMMTVKASLRNPAVDLARHRHIGTREKREKVADYWRTNIDPKLSAQRAADLIVMAGITDLSHKKIAEIVSPLRKAER